MSMKIALALRLRAEDSGQVGAGSEFSPHADGVRIITISVLILDNMPQLEAVNGANCIPQ
jgi:hypothetical protein